MVRRFVPRFYFFWPAGCRFGYLGSGGARFLSLRRSLRLGFFLLVGWGVLGLGLGREIFVLFIGVFSGRMNIFWICEVENAAVRIVVVPFSLCGCQGGYVEHKVSDT